MDERVGAVVIGRNEGERLVRCLNALRHFLHIMVYVDSDSSDGSVAAAQTMGIEVVPLDLSIPFTAARARNAGFARLIEIAPDIEFIQFVDGDCELAPNWLKNGIDELMDDPKLSIVCGYQREIHPEATIWNALMDAEWNGPIGEINSCGGNALMRRKAFEEVEGFRAELIAGEEPELSLRLRRKGWKVRRIAVDMNTHDACMNKFSQWWQRARRAGHTYAEGAALYGTDPERYRVVELRRAIVWGAGIPAVTLLGSIIVSPWLVLTLILWPLQVLRLVVKGVPGKRAFFLTLSKLPEAQGAIDYWLNRILGRTRDLIEYK